MAKEVGDVEGDEVEEECPIIAMKVRINRQNTVVGDVADEEEVEEVLPQLSSRMHTHLSTPHSHRKSSMENQNHSLPLMRKKHRVMGKIMRQKSALSVHRL